MEEAADFYFHTQSRRGRKSSSVVYFIIGNGDTDSCASKTIVLLFIFNNKKVDFLK